MKAKQWGSDVVPKSEWIKQGTQYRTREGHKVIGIHIVLRNSLGNEVTFPVKGSIVRKNCEPRYQIWTLGGNAVLFSEHKDDLIEDES